MNKATNIKQAKLLIKILQEVGPTLSTEIHSEIMDMIEVLSFGQTLASEEAES